MPRQKRPSQARSFASTSSAAGLYQFTGGTWLQTVDRHGTRHGLDWAASAIEGGRVDPAMRAQIMAMRFDPNASALMAAELANDNKAALTGLLGRAPDAAELYMAHFLGAEGATKFLAALQSDPTQSAAALLPSAAAANRGIFYDAAGPRSVAGVMDLMRSKVSAAIGGAGLPPPTYGPGQFASAPPPTPAGGPLQREFTALADQANAANRPSMADTLRSDHLDAYGYARQTAPTLTAMASRGALFSHCVTQATWTKVAAPTLMTSLYPSTHGVADFSDRLSASARTLAESYREAGAATLSLCSIPFTGKFTNLHQGFEELHEDTSLSDQDSSKTAREYVALAGGATTRGRLDNTVVTFRNGRTYAMADAPPLEPGAVVTVPEVAVKWWQDYVTILSTIATLATAYTGLYFIFHGQVN